MALQCLLASPVSSFGQFFSFSNHCKNQLCMDSPNFRQTRTELHLIWVPGCTPPLTLVPKLSSCHRRLWLLSICLVGVCACGEKINKKCSGVNTLREQMFPFSSGKLVDECFLFHPPPPDHELSWIQNPAAFQKNLQTTHSHLDLGSKW